MHYALTLYLLSSAAAARYGTRTAPQCSVQHTMKPAGAEMLPPLTFHADMAPMATDTYGINAMIQHHVVCAHSTKQPSTTLCSYYTTVNSPVRRK